MLDVFRSKVMVLFMLFVIGVIFIDCSFNKNFDGSVEQTNLVLNY